MCLDTSLVRCSTGEVNQTSIFGGLRHYITSLYLGSRCVPPIWTAVVWMFVQMSSMRRPDGGAVGVFGF